MSASCRDTGGDGVAVYDYPWSPATVTIDKTRIDSVRRSAIARFGGKVSAIDSTMACASGKAVASADALTLARSQCGCEDWTLCRPSEAKLSPALSGLDGCTAGAPCARYCFRDVTAETAAVANGGHAAGLELVMWEFDDDSVASEFARKNVDSTLACVDFGGLSPGEHRLAFGQGGVTQVQRGAGVVPSIGIVKTISENAGPHFMLPFAAEGSISSQRSSRAMFRSAHTPMKI